MAFDAGPPKPEPYRDLPTPWWEWASRLLGGGLFIAIYIAWLVHTTAPAIRALFGEAP